MLLRITGELDRGSVGFYEDQIQAAARDGVTDLILDFDACLFADVSALTLIVRARRAHMQVTVRNPTYTVLRMLVISGLDAEVTIEE